MSKKKELKKLSPSRIDTLLNCSWSYYCNYILKLPDTGNPGSKRGSIIHDLYECLAKNVERHKWKYEKMLAYGNIYKVECIRRFVRAKARQYDLNLNDFVVTRNGAGLIQNYEFINEMVLVGLNTEFYGKEGDVIVAEEAHSLDVDDKERGIRYVARGFVDKAFERFVDGKIDEVEIVDYKSSKRKFDKKKIEFNMQGVIYQMFLKKKYPDVKNIFMNFLFLQFPRGPWQSARPVDDEIIEGVEIYLTYLFNKINNFTKEDGKSNFAKHNGLAPFCGKDGFKNYKDKDLGRRVQSPEPAWKCPYKDPYDYYALVDSDGEVIKTSINEGSLSPKDGQSVQKKRYGGCLAWHKEEESDSSCDFSFMG